ncbi:MAG: glycosyltransferase family 9 protein [Candidatus Kapabacteria bacterium]|nr:glycosyltransferase family 9 protein [Candidatus Kapabacteria bacterium]
MPDTVRKRVELLLRGLLRKMLTGSREPQLIDHAVSVMPAGRPLRMLLLRQDRIGDVFVSEPLIRALREAFPTSVIDVVLSPNNLAARHAIASLIDDVLIYRKRIVDVVRLMRTMRNRRYDVMIDLMDNPSTTSTLLLRLSGIPIRIGIDKANRQAYSHVVPLLDRSRVHIVERLANLLMPFGINPGTVALDLRYPCSEQEVQRARQRLGSDPRPALAVNITGTDQARRFGVDQWADVIRMIRERHRDWRVVLMSAPSDVDVLHQLARETGADLVEPSSSFHDFAVTVLQCQALITADTSIVHVAAAHKLPQVVMYVHANPALMPWYPYASPHVARCASSQVRDIPAVDVADAVDALFLRIATS